MVLSVLAVIWLYPVVVDAGQRRRSSADIYRAPWDVPWPPAIGNLGEAWSRGQLGVAMANSAYVTVMTVASCSRCRSAARMRSPGCDRPAAPCCSCWSWPR